ncbi:hypothetical protein CIK05_01275 [Bdellovibrio sp. qaytius]|nr:hypothetical protein CIK05_01275 [Bdellovibrio sp. qaytius]
MKLTTHQDLKQFPQTHYVFVEKIGPFQDTAMAAWQELHKHVESIGSKNKISGYFSQYKVEPQMIYRAGLAVDAKPATLPEGFKYENFAGGVFQRFTLIGGYQNLPEACGAVFAQIEKEKLPMRNDWFVENYINSPKETAEDSLVTEILIPTESNIKPFSLSREFQASKDLMWQCWTDKNHLEKWSGPKGSKLKNSVHEFKTGATNHYCMTMPDGNESWGLQVYRDIVKPDRVVYVTSFSDSKGNKTRHPMSATWPLEMLTTITLLSLGDKTRVTIEWMPINASAEEIKTFNDAHDGMKMGWGGSLDTLETYLKTLT